MRCVRGELQLSQARALDGFGCRAADNERTKEYGGEQRG
jgi:hypothetical protein